MVRSIQHYGTKKAFKKLVEISLPLSADVCLYALALENSKFYLPTRQKLFFVRKLYYKAFIRTYLFENVSISTILTPSRVIITILELLNAISLCILVNHSNKLRKLIVLLWEGSELKAFLKSFTKRPSHTLSALPMKASTRISEWSFSTNLVPPVSFFLELSEFSKPCEMFTLKAYIQSLTKSPNDTQSRPLIEALINALIENQVSLELSEFSKLCEMSMLKAYIKSLTKSPNDQSRPLIKALVDALIENFYVAEACAEAIDPNSRDNLFWIPLEKPILRLNERHHKNILYREIICSNDVESNPGPVSHSTNQAAKKSSLNVTSYNVRGLKEETKLRHLLNYFHKKSPGKNSDFIACLQETYLEKEGKIPYMWRGNFYLTPGEGNSGGCLTLLSPHISVVAGESIGNRAHIIVCQRSGETKAAYIIVNLYAPNPNTVEKIEFFEGIFELLQDYEIRYNCFNSLVVGDFNLNLKLTEVKNRMFTAQEQRVAQIVKELCNGNRMRDLWDDNSSYTWRRGNTDTFSTIDRILYNYDSLKVVNKGTNWSVSYSDHAAVEVGLVLTTKEPQARSRITRLDPTLVQIPECKIAIETGVRDMLRDALQEWDPHLKLEYAKMCIRTVTERVQAERKRKEKSEEDIVDEELNLAIECLSNSASRGNLIEYIEDLRNRKSAIVERRGTRLAEKLKTKWYNEGEKSSKYFFRILNRSMPDDFKELTRSDGSTASTSEDIEAEITAYYKALYEDEREVEINDDDNDNFLNEIMSISGQDAAWLMRPITSSELRETLHSCSDSAPGPDGIPYSILGLVWPDFGPILTAAWNHSLRVGKLPHSHRTSYLKLIPKAGKDLKKLTNWRPITLSNCDHKLITKTYSKRFCEKMDLAIGEGQTAYLKGRLINDNIRSMAATVKVSTLEEDAAGLIVALDAKKAFDSVSHNYIKKCLVKFGCADFVPIFNVLYANLSTDILINGKIVKGFNIKRGVKQGDALSCIIFIMCMEPLIRNIKCNPLIKPIRSTTLNADLPKSYAYADDINAVIKDENESLQQVFNEYQRLTKISGLSLNADKTEIMRLGKDPIERLYTVRYLESTFNIVSSPEVKINGILFQRNERRMVERNVEAVLQKIDSQFKSWSRRRLTTLGKVLIVKTFGLSQIMYLMQSLVLNETDFKRLNSILYKFIWNKHFRAAKAPERIKREIVNKPVNMGGLGMLDVKELDSSLKIKSLGRLVKSNHPMLSMIKEGLNLDNFFAPSCRTNVEVVTCKALEILKADRDRLWQIPELNNDAKLISTIRQLDLRSIVSRTGRTSITFFNLWTRGRRKVKDLTNDDLKRLEVFVDRNKIIKVSQAVSIRIDQPKLLTQIYTNKMFKDISNCSSKEIRLSRCNNEPITLYKCELDLNGAEARSWLLRMSKLSSTLHKNTILRYLHGEIYTKERLFRFGLTESPTCPRCDSIETLNHKFIDCAYVRKIWDEANRLTNKIRTIDPIRDALAIAPTSLEDLTIHAEIFLRILSLRDDQSYLLLPKVFVKMALKDLLLKEGKEGIRSRIKDLLEIN